MMYEIDLAWVTANPQAALDMIDRLMKERDDAKALAAASAAGYAAVRKALIEMGRMIPGVILADEVSSDFLLLLPAELAAWQDNLEQQACGAAAPEQPASAAGCERGVEDAILLFREALPGWWYTLGECEVSCDASCGPTRLSPDVALIPHDERFNSGFHIDVPQPSTLAEALTAVMTEAVAAREALPAPDASVTEREG